MDKSGGKTNSEGHPIQNRLFPGKVLGSIPVKLELQNGTGSGFQCSALKAGARCDTLSTPWLPAATFVAASLKDVFLLISFFSENNVYILKAQGFFQKEI